MACASTVAVVVPSPAMSDVLLATSRTICAPMFSSGSLRSISFATVTPSLVIVGDPNFLSSTTLRPFGPNVTFTASANWLTPRSTAWRDCSPYTICFAILFSPVALGCQLSGVKASLPCLLKADSCELIATWLLLLLAAVGAAFDDRQDFVLAH